MAQKTVVTVVCDLPHDGEVEGTETVSFAFDGTAYEIDVCAAHAKELREKFGQYTERARRASSAAAAGRRRRTRSGPGRERSSEIRAWAKQRGHKVSERGRIPAAIIAEYESSH
jgi:Lsr2